MRETINEPKKTNKSKIPTQHRWNYMASQKQQPKPMITKDNPKKYRRIIKIKNGQSIGITWHHLTWQAKIQPKQRVARDQPKKYRRIIKIK